MKLTTHFAAAAPDRLTEPSPLVYAPRSRSLYVGLSLGRGRHYEVYNLMQRLGALTSATARDAHGYYLPDGTFEWYEHFSVPSRAEEEDIRASIEAMVVPGGRGRRARPAGRIRRFEATARSRLRPVRAATRSANAIIRSLELLVRPPRPPREAPARVRDLSRVEPYDEFITGNGFASRCRCVLNYDVLTVNEEIENNWWFCKSDWLEYFFRELAPDSPFVLVTSNSDRTIGREFARRLRRSNLVAWFAVNAAFSHPKLFALPLGLGDPSLRYGHAGGDVRAVQRTELSKTQLFEVGFDVKTNPRERLRCLEQTGLELDPRVPKRAYLERMASSYFSVAPSGNGIDTHRLWEALYLRTVPVVKRSLLTDQHPDLPLVVLDDWAEFGSIDFSPELYARTWGDWEPAALGLDAYLRRVSRTLEELRRHADT